MSVCYIFLFVLVSSSGENVQNPLVNTTSERRQEIVDQIGKTLCRYTNFCRRQKEDLNDKNMEPCCTRCDCGDQCWKLGNCCPDKEGFDEREPIANCRASVVKKAESNWETYNGIKHDVNAYRVIDDCPESEQNLTIINKCTLSDIDHISDYCWVTDNSTGHIYQNRFCAACHGVEQFIEWQLVSRCTELLFSNFSHINSLLLSEKCDIINREPDELDHLYQRCVISEYTRCNQTGLWEHYDPDIEWACNTYDSVFFYATYKKEYLYKNAFCFACNNKEFHNAQAACQTTRARGSGTTPPAARFSVVVDYRRNDDLGTEQADFEPECAVNEIMDPYLLKCRHLLCPFLNAPVYGKCEQLVKTTYGLSVEAIYTVSALWSKTNISVTDNKTKLSYFAKGILYNFKPYIGSCGYCYLDVRLVKEIVQSKSTLGEFLSCTTYCNSTEPNFLVYYRSSTSASCSLPDLIQNAEQVAGSEFRINGPDWTTAMHLKIEHLKDEDQYLIDGSKELEHEYSEDYKCFLAYRLTTEKNCPKVRVSVSDFTHFLTVNKILKSVFTDRQRRLNESKEICVDDYFERLSHVIRPVRKSGSSKLGMETFFCTGLIVTAQWMFKIY